MARETWVWRNGEMVLKGGPDDTGHPNFAGRRNRSDVPCPHFIKDHLDDLVGQHDGRVYDSKSALRNSYRSAGLEEIGNEEQSVYDAEDRLPDLTADEVEQAYAKVSQGYKPTAPVEPVEI